jgi:hypothetical protein
VVKEESVGIAPRRKVGMLAAEGEDAEVLFRLCRQRGRILDVCGDVAVTGDAGGVRGRGEFGEAAMLGVAVGTCRRSFLIFRMRQSAVTFGATRVGDAAPGVVTRPAVLTNQLAALRIFRPRVRGRNPSRHERALFLRLGDLGHDEERNNQEDGDE